MLKTSLIDRKEQAAHLFAQLLGSSDMPPYLFDDYRYHGILLCLYEDNKPVGFQYGVSTKKDSVLHIHKIFLSKQYRTGGNLLTLIRAFIEQAWKHYQIKYGLWSYEMLAKQNDPYQKIFQRLDNYHVDTHLVLHQYQVRTADFSKLRKFHWYVPELLKKKGYEAVSWAGFLDFRKAQIRHREIQMKDADSGYLSPFIQDNTWNYDEKTSFALVTANTQIPLGWILCEKLSETDVKLRRFYIYKDVRNHLLGPAFSCYVLDVISSIYKTMCFDVAEGNEQMERVAQWQFGPIMAQSSLLCHMKIMKKD